MADSTRLELATSAVTGQRSNQLSYGSNKSILYYFFLFCKSYCFIAATKASISEMKKMSLIILKMPLEIMIQPAKMRAEPE